MNREMAFAILVSALCGSAVMAAGWWPFRRPLASNGQALERSAWLRIWFPFGPAFVLFAMLGGWVLVEPARAERLPFGLLVSGLPFAAIFARAAWRAFGSLALPRQEMTAATIGFFRPRIILSPQFISALDQRGLVAALEHERAHARHRDPLRLWLAQFGSDLSWPSPAAAARLRCWRGALELARDEEARSAGVVGPDLAAAIIVSMRFNQGRLLAGTATLADEAFLKERVARLLQPVETGPRPGAKSLVLLVIVAVTLLLAVLMGIQHGEVIVRSFLKIA
jgi:hypothetical protein